MIIFPRLHGGRYPPCVDMSIIYTAKVLSMVKNQVNRQADDKQKVGRLKFIRPKDCPDYAYGNWQVSWAVRNMIAVGLFAICALATAYGVTGSIERERRVERAAKIEANEVQKLADYAAFMARETKVARQTVSLDGNFSAAIRLRDQYIENDYLSDLVSHDLSEIDLARLEARERTCLAQAIYFEARSEARIGQAAVADVVLNRVQSRIYPDTICDVVFQGSERVTGCQFSFTCDGSMDNVILNQRNRKWVASVAMAGSIMAGLRAPVSREATHYHADYVNPPWASTLAPTATIGTHKFYRFNTRKVNYGAPAGM